MGPLTQACQRKGSLNSTMINLISTGLTIRACRLQNFKESTSRILQKVLRQGEMRVSSTIKNKPLKYQRQKSS
jgi:hypothetical protein